MLLVKTVVVDRRWVVACSLKTPRRARCAVSSKPSRLLARQGSTPSLPQRASLHDTEVNDLAEVIPIAQGRDLRMSLIITTWIVFVDLSKVPRTVTC